MHVGDGSLRDLRALPDRGSFWASLEHQLRYKKNLPDEEAAAVAAELADLAETAADLDRRMQALRNYLDDGEE